MLEMDANILIFALIMINIIFVVWVRIPFLTIFGGLITAIMAGLINGSSIFPWLNIILLLVSVFCIVSTFKN